MSILYGITADGQSVPVQVTDDGKLVTSGGGSSLWERENETLTPTNEGDDVEAQAASFVSSLNVSTSDDSWTAGAPPVGYAGTSFRGAGAMQAARPDDSAAIFKGWSTSAAIDPSNISKVTSQITGAGAATFAGDKAGFDAEGQLIFSSRGDRYRVIVQNGLMTAELFTRETELREKAEKFKGQKPDAI